jgi:RNA polymerase sigma-70 factor (ECF subfamily)
MDHVEENRIIAEILAGDANAYAILVQRYQGPVFNLMVRMTGSEDEASDLSQDAFIKAYRNLERFKPGRRFFPWLYSIAMNVARDHLRKRRVQLVWIDDVKESNPGMSLDADQERELIRKLDARLVNRALDTLPVEYRESLVLRFREELSLKEIAQALELSVSGAKMRVSRGLEKLRKAVLELDKGISEQG